MSRPQKGGEAVTRRVSISVCLKLAMLTSVNSGCSKKSTTWKTSIREASVKAIPSGAGMEAVVHEFEGEFVREIGVDRGGKALRIGSIN